jgi:hypothetical protein
LGATHAQIAAHDVSTYELFAAPCCGEVQSVLVYMGTPYPEASCEGCKAPLSLGPETRYRVATLKGEVYEGHPCPRCQAPELRFVPGESFL